MDLVWILLLVVAVIVVLAIVSVWLQRRRRSGSVLSADTVRQSRGSRP